MRRRNIRTKRVVLVMILLLLDVATLAVAFGQAPANGGAVDVNDPSDHTEPLVPYRTPNDCLFSPLPLVEVQTSAIQAEIAGLKETVEQIKLWLWVLAGLMVLGLVATLANTVVLLRRPQPHNTKGKSDPGDPPSKALAEPPRSVGELRMLPLEPGNKVGASARSLNSIPPASAVSTSPPESPAADEFAGLPHGAIGRALCQLHRALPGLASNFSDPRQKERFLSQLDQPLKARIERFKEATRKGDPYLREHWIEPDLVTTLNALAQLLSQLIEERYRGRRGNPRIEEELKLWLYERLAPICRNEGWFDVEPILPYTTKFDPTIHHSVGSKELEGARNLVVEIKAIGRRHPRQNYVTHKAEVIVGR